ncbi:MAG: hypothetical protein M1831_003094 [Alyxoria varia]|nr:MAG: hypothetical protein M1831_003094 [Alyxoria varia]
MPADTFGPVSPSLSSSNTSMITRGSASVPPSTSITPPTPETAPETAPEPDETTSLLPKKPPSPDDSSPSGQHHHDSSDPNSPSDLSFPPEPPPSFGRVLKEMRLLLASAIPLMLAYTLQNSLQTVSVLIVGRLSPAALAIAAFGYMFATATGWLIALGGTTAIDTLASANFTGNKGNPKELGTILQRAFIVLGAFYVPVAGIVWCVFGEKLLVALHQEPWLAKEARKFLVVLAPGGLGYIYFEALKKYLQAQRIMRPGTYVLLFTSLLNAGLNYALIHGIPAPHNPSNRLFELGILGAPLATGISYWLSFLLLLLYARTVHAQSWRTHWGGWSKASFTHLVTFARLAFAGILHVGTEWWAFEIVALVAGSLGEIPLAAQSVIMTADQVINTLPFGLGIATTPRIGNLLGLKRPRGTKLSAHTSATLSVLLGLTICLTLLASANVFGRLFNNDARVVKLVAEVMPWVAAFQIGDALNNSCGGTLRGLGKQHAGATINVLCYYAVALPLGVWLAISRGWGLQGLWLGQCVALWSVGVVEWIWVAFTDWETEVRRAFARMGVDFEVGGKVADTVEGREVVDEELEGDADADVETRGQGMKRQGERRDDSSGKAGAEV